MAAALHPVWGLLLQEGYWHTTVSSVEANQDGQGAGEMYGESLREPGWELTVAYNYIIRGYGEDGAGLFSEALTDKMSWNLGKSHWRSGFVFIFLNTVRVVNIGTSFWREVVDLYPWSCPRVRWMWPWTTGFSYTCFEQEVGLVECGGPFQPELQFCDQVFNPHQLKPFWCRSICGVSIYLNCISNKYFLQECLSCVCL